MAIYINRFNYSLSAFCSFIFDFALFCTYSSLAYHTGESRYPAFFPTPGFRFSTESFLIFCHSDFVLVSDFGFRTSGLFDYCLLLFGY